MSLTQGIIKAIEAMLVAIEAGSCLAKAEGQGYAPDRLQRALNEGLGWLAEVSLYLLGLIGVKEGG